MPARRVLEAARLDTTLVPEDRPDTQPKLDPQLAAFLAEIETGWRTMDQQARELAERGTRALFRVEDVRRSRRVTKHDEGFDKPKNYERPQLSAWLRNASEHSEARRVAAQVGPNHFP